MTWWMLWGEHAVLTGGMLWILAMAWGAGHFALRLLRLRGARTHESALLSLGLGLGLMSLLLLAFGMAGLYGGRAFVFLCLCLSLAAVLAGIERWRAGDGRADRRGLAVDEIPAAVLLAAGVLFTWLTALSPPIFFDALEYHLAVPNLYLIRGGIEPIPHLVLSNYPLGAEMLYGLATWVGGPVMAGMVNFGLGLACAAVVASLAYRWRGRSAALMAALLFYVTPMETLLSRFATSENAMTLYFLLLIYCLLRLGEEGKYSWALLAGVFGGFACGTKLVAGLFAASVPALLLLAGPAPSSVTTRRSWKTTSLALLAAGAAAAASPWFLKNYLFTGNPFYPALSTLFPTAGWGPEQERMLTASAHASWLRALSWKEYFFLPWKAAAGYERLGAAAKPLPLLPISLACAAAVLVRERAREARLPALAQMLYVLIWVASFWMVRFLLPAVALGAVLTSGCLAGRGESGRRWLASAAAAVLAIFSLVVVFRDGPTVRSLSPSLGMESRGEYLGNLLRSYPAVEFINLTLPRDARVLVLGETKVAYLRRDHLYQTVFDAPIADYILEGGSGDIGDGLRGRGITHVLVNLEEMERMEAYRQDLPFTNATLKALLDYLGAEGKLLLFGNRVFLFALQS